MIKEFFNERAASWDETAAEKDATKLEEMARRMAIVPGSEVLDVGTGTGVLVPFILGRMGGKGRLVCLDIAEEMLETARSKGFEGNIEYICTDIAANRLDGNSFDAAVCYSSFPHFQDKPKALEEINRLLRKGGRLFICHTSSRDAINDVHRQIPAVENDLIPDEAEMRQLLSAAGFGEISIRDDTDNYLASARKLEG